MQKKKVVQFQKEFDLRVSMLKSISVSFNSRIILLISQDQILIMSMDFGFITKRIKRQASIRFANLSGNGKYILAHFSDNSLRIFSSKSGLQVAHLIGMPAQCRHFQISQNGNKIVASNNQILSIWDLKKSKLTLSCRNWKNINCFAANKTGIRVAIGTYNGAIFIIKELGNNKCSEIEFHILKKCIVCLAWEGDNLIAIDYDKNILIFNANIAPTKITEGEGEQQQCTYKQYQISFMPKELSVVNGVFYIVEQKGIHWFENKILMGLDQYEWMVCKGTQKKTIFFYTDKGYLKFWTLAVK